jgi:hypothetical protein
MMEQIRVCFSVEANLVEKREDGRQEMERRNGSLNVCSPIHINKVHASR